MIRTFVAVSNRIKVDIVLVVADKEQAEPRIKGIHWHNKQDADDVALLIGDSVGPKVCIDLKIQKQRIWKTLVNKKQKKMQIH